MMAKRESAGRLLASVGVESAPELPQSVLAGPKRPNDGSAPGDHEERLARMFAALSATNEAIMHAQTRAELLVSVCEAAVHGGKFNATVIALAEADSDFLRIAAVGGPKAETVRGLKLAASAAYPEGRGLSGTAFRTRLPCISNYYLTDARINPFRDKAEEGGIKSGAALPLLSRGAAVGIMLFLSSEQDAFTPELVALLQQLSENISFALENFDRAEGRRRVDVQKERLSRMFAALSAANKAILHARSVGEMFQSVCDAATGPGKFLGASVQLFDPTSSWFVRVATSGRIRHIYEQVRNSVDLALPEGQGPTAAVFRTGKPCFIDDLSADPRLAPLRALLAEAGVISGAILPLTKGGRVVGACSFFFDADSGPFDDDQVQLTTRISQNISFGMEMFDHQEQKNNVTRMFEALSATNEAIMRAQTRAELFDLVCEAAVKGGDFTSILIATQEAGSDYMTVESAAGPMAQSSKRTKLSVDTGRPEERGLTWSAFRGGRPYVANDYCADVRAPRCLERARREGARSGAALPLFCRGRTVGVLLFLSRAPGAFTTALVELLERLAANVSFALDNFDRAEARRLAEEQKDRLTRMFAALSATNEAIMRARTRSELFELVCEAAVQGGNFASTIVGLAESGNDFLKIVACAGPRGHLQRNIRIAVSEKFAEGRGLSGVAFRTAQPCVSNDYLADRRGKSFHQRAWREGNRSGASLPLLSCGRPVGVLTILASEPNAFNAELVELLARLASNVSFALDNFHRADEKAKADERIQYLATHDGLTGLPNRAKFAQLLHQSLEAARRGDLKLAILFIDIDRFKVVNDSLGHDAGDALLIEIGKRLRNALGAGDFVSRLGGDEFVVILEQAAEAGRIETAARNLLSVISQPIELRGVEYRATASVGIAIFPDDGEDEGTLTKNADMAMYCAKDDGKNGFRFFNRQSKMQSVERLIFEARLRQALDREELSLHYQPKVDAATGDFTGVEALLRWTLPDLGILPPMQFIPLAEETGMIVPIGRWVLKQACAQNMAWRNLGLAPMSMAVNLSPRQFSDENLLRDVDDALAASGMPPELLQLEITEGMMMHNVGRAIEVLNVIRRRGVRIAIDDFGTGYSSMSLMKKFPIDALKIDRSFVKDLPHDTEDRAIAQAIISMGKALGLTIVAEGVETAEQAAFLRECACDEMQGYLFSKPVCADEIIELVQGAGRDAAGRNVGVFQARVSGLAAAVGGG
jgi:diguanylate cyclase (GGDEF)-like protein